MVKHRTYIKQIDVGFIDSKLRILLSDLHIKTTVFGGEVVLIIPKGFATDLASIPRGLWWLYSPTDWFVMGPSIAHDWCYDNEVVKICSVKEDKLSACRKIKVNKQIADNLFKEKTIDFGATKLQNFLVYTAVKLFGKPKYHKTSNTKT